MKIESPQHGYVALTPAMNWRCERGEAEGLRYVAMFPETDDAELRLTPGGPDEAGRSASKWIDTVAAMSRTRKRPVHDIQLGPFKGCLVEFAAMDLWIRGWSLQCDELMLSICYRCKKDIRGRDDVVVSEMLGTLETGGI